MSEPVLHWCPKPFGPGDIDGEGAKRLLGQPEVDLPNLLIRETAQNSWDARLPGHVPVFEVRFRELTPESIEVLRGRVFTNSHANLGIDDFLGATTSSALEIADRNTYGLSGPTRADVEAALGERTDFRDFVLSVGAPRDNHLGGGTYGFGKTASYLASGCGTIIIWTRVKTPEGRLQYRLIASGIGGNFTLDGQRYTGRHWWGTPFSAGGNTAFRVDPIVGDAAERLGDKLFERSFRGDETGTSILVLDPVGAGEPSDLVDRWRTAIGWNLWPKLIPHQAGQRAMKIELVDRGRPVDLLKPQDSPALEAAVRCAAAIRAVQAHDPEVDPSIVKEIWCLNPKKLVGHLALARYIPSAVSDPLGSMANSVIYMRHQAELVVKAREFWAAQDGLTSWVGVFKPVREMDDYFAAAEPPAHDNWTPAGMLDPHGRTFVKVALERVAQAVKAYLTPSTVDPAVPVSASTGEVSKALAGLAGSALGARAVAKAERERRRASTGWRSPRAKVDVVDIVPEVPSPQDLAEGRQRTLVRLGVTAAGLVVVRAESLKLAIDGSSIASEGEVRLERWFIGESLATRSALSPPVGTGSQLSAEISYPSGVAVDFSFVAGEA